MPNAYYLKLGSGTEQITGGSRDKCYVGWIKAFLVLDGRHEQVERRNRRRGGGTGNIP